MKKYDSLIIGAGPAGVSCAIWLKQLGFNPAIFDKRPKAGGLQLDNAYSNTWIASSFDVTGLDVVNSLNSNLKKFKVDSFFNSQLSPVRQIQGGFLVENSGCSFQAKTIVLATGVVHSSGNLRERANILIGPGFKVASRDFSNKKVAILGGGDNAFENYLFIKEKGASSIKIFSRTLKARASFLAAVPLSDVFEGTYQIDEESLTVNGEVFDVILACYGYSVSLDAVLGLNLAHKKGGFIQTDQNCRTSLPSVYAIGEITNNFHPCCVTSMAEGVIAAKAIQSELESNFLVEYRNKIKKASNLFVKIIK